MEFQIFNFFFNCVQVVENRIPLNRYSIKNNLNHFINTANGHLRLTNSFYLRSSVKKLQFIAYKPCVKHS